MNLSVQDDGRTQFGLPYSACTPRPAVLAAPMAGVSDLPFRVLAHHFGADMTWSEMISAQGIIRCNPNTWTLLRGVCASEYPVMAQIFGGEADAVRSAVERVLARHSPVGIDLNMGCPVRKVVRTGAGASLMCQPARAASIVSSVRDALDAHPERPLLSVKIRSGWDEHRVNAAEFAACMQGAGADLICVHARTRSMFYSGRADWDIIGRVVQHVRIPVVGNGDIENGPDAEAMLSETGCAAVMIGRASIGRPWVFRRVRACLEGEDDPGEPAPGEKLALAVLHARMESAFRGEPRGVIFSRRQLHRYVRGLPGSAGLRDKINRCDSVDSVVQLFSKYARRRSLALYSPDAEELSDMPAALARIRGG